MVIAPQRWYAGALPPRDLADHYAFEAGAGQLVTVSLAPSPLCAVTIVDATGAAIPTQCSLQAQNGFATYRATLPASGTWFVRVSGAYAAGYRVGFTLDAPVLRATEPLGRPGAAGPDATCGTGAPVTATSGDGPGGLVFAALKAGTRAVVAWTTEAPTTGALAWNVSGGATTTLTEATPRTAHVFVLDELPRGESLCFSADGGAPRALRLANAMHAHDGDAYVVNLLVLANEQPNVGALEAGLDAYAWRLRDATDGHVKSGRVIVLYEDAGHHNSGWTTCYMTVSVATGDAPTCDLAADVIFTVDAYPAGAASTYGDGIQNPRASIWMNSYWQAGTVNLGDDVGAVLMHEVGHYAFGALDLYVGSGCDVPEKSLSVMSSDRSLTEFDDEVNRCPNEAEVEGYVPTWTLLRQRFPLVPDRLGVIDAGPTTAGDAYVRTSFDVVPLSASSLPQDDAGSGRDAPDFPTGEVVVAPGAWYLGAIGAGDGSDHYAFEGLAGQAIAIRMGNAALCVVSLVDDAGNVVPVSCLISGQGGTVHHATLPHDGRWHLRVSSLAGAYRFGFTLDAPPLGPLDG